jgi:hypothetical protein
MRHGLVLVYVENYETTFNQNDQITFREYLEHVVACLTYWYGTFGTKPLQHLRECSRFCNLDLLQLLIHLL